MRRKSSNNKGLIVNGFGVVNPTRQGVNPLAPGSATRRASNMQTQFGRNVKRGR